MKLMVTAWHTVTTWAVTANSSTPMVNPWAEPVAQFTLPILSGILILVFGELIKDWLKDRIQKLRDGKSKTPVVIKFG